MLYKLNSIKYYMYLCGDVVQMGERLSGRQEVGGSSPLISTSRYKPVRDMVDPCSLGLEKT